jgi:dCTP deaminase
MILPYQELIRRGPDLLDPFEAGNVQPASIDLRLGSTFQVPRRDLTHVDLACVPESTTTQAHVDDGHSTLGADGFVLHPGKGVLAATLERIRVPDDLVMVIDGKSSLGRLFLAAHVTAGYFDPGWDGIGTLELVNLSEVAITLRPGRLICQSRWMRLTAPCKRPYRGRYQGAEEAQGSRYGQ